jgi:glucose-6-phosphate 1-dehydrogenase
LQW